MPILKSAIKKLKQAKVKAERNRGRKRALKEAIEEFKKKPTAKLLSSAFSHLDKIAKVGVIHKNKAARLKSRLSKKLK